MAERNSSSGWPGPGQPTDLIGDSAVRELPNSQVSEACLLGTIMMNNQALDQVSDFLKADHFYSAVHAKIYSMMVRMVAEGREANQQTLNIALGTDPMIVDAGGMRFLVGLSYDVVTYQNARNYGQIIFDTWQRRRIIEIIRETYVEAFDAPPDSPATEMFETVERELFNVAETRQYGHGFHEFPDIADEALEQIQIAIKYKGQTVGVPTGLSDLDLRLGGLRGGNLYFIGGRPGMGKTGLATTIGVNAAKYFRSVGDKRPDHAGKSVAFFSLEMTGAELAHRVVCAHAEVNAEAARLGKIDQGEVNKLIVARNELSDLLLRIEDTSALTVAQMMTRARRLHRKHGLGIVFVDYLGLARASNTGANKVHQIEEVTNGLKAMAKQLNVPVVCLVQLSRAVESRNDRRPMLADLRDSGSIENDADTVLFIYRDYYYLERDEPRKAANESQQDFGARMIEWEASVAGKENLAELIISKNRHGRLGTVEVYFNAARTTFTDLARRRDTGEMTQAERDLLDDQIR